MLVPHTTQVCRRGCLWCNRQCSDGVDLRVAQSTTMCEMTTYPIYYGTQRVTMERLVAIFGPKMHPEYHRRVFPFIESCGGILGIGGGWRANGTQPDRTGFAPEGRSFHQYQTFRSGTVAYCALDLVVYRGGGLVHRAPRDHETANERLYGLHTNIDSEDWHLQPIEISGWQSWVNRGRPDPTFFPLPDGPATPPYVPGLPIPTEPPPTGGVMILNPPTLRVGAADTNWTEKLQAIMPQFGQDVGPIDGIYGERTKRGVTIVQQFFGYELAGPSDGICGPKTWAIVLGVAP